MLKVKILLIPAIKMALEQRESFWHANGHRKRKKHAKIDFQLTGFRREQSRTEFEFWLFDLNAKSENPANSCH